MTMSSSDIPAPTAERTRQYLGPQVTFGDPDASDRESRLNTQRNFIRSAARVLLLLLVLLLLIPIPGSAEDGNTFVRSVLLAFLAISVAGIVQHIGATLRLIGRTWPVWVLLLWLLATSQWASYPDISIRRSFAYITIYFIAVSLAVSFEHATDFQRPLYQGLALIFLINSVAAAVIPANDPNLGVNGIYAQKNSAGAIALYVIMVMTFSIGLQRSLLTNLFSICIAVLGWAFLISTNAKTSVAAAVLLFIIIPILSFLLPQPKIYKLVAGILCITLFGVVVFFIQVLNITLEELGKAIFTDLTFTNRTFIWNALIPEISLHPWTGAGFGSFWATGRHLNPIASAPPNAFFMDAKAYNEAHNGYIDITLQAGFIGLALALFVIARCIWQLCCAIGTPRTDPDGRISCRILLALALAIALGNLTESTIFEYSNPIGYLFVLIVVQAERWRLGYELQHRTEQS